MTNKAGEQPTITQAEKDAAALKPCPWCGATCIVVTADNQDFAAACGFCRCFGPRNVSRTEAMAAWNTRASLAAQDGLVEAIEDLRHNYRAADAGGEFIIVSIYSVNAVLDALSAIKGDKS